MQIDLVISWFGWVIFESGVIISWFGVVILIRSTERDNGVLDCCSQKCSICRRVCLRCSRIWRSPRQRAETRMSVKNESFGTRRKSFTLSVSFCYVHIFARTWLSVVQSRVANRDQMWKLQGEERKIHTVSKVPIYLHLCTSMNVTNLGRISCHAQAINREEKSKLHTHIQVSFCVHQSERRGQSLPLWVRFHSEHTFATAGPCIIWAEIRPSCKRGGSGLSRGIVAQCATLCKIIPCSLLTIEWLCMLWGQGVSIMRTWELTDVEKTFHKIWASYQRESLQM